MIICLIPARIGSKRIKEKNIKKFFGKPLISYAIANARKSKLFDKIIISTDSLKIAKIAKKYGGEVPYLRSKKLADDKTKDKSVLFDFLKRYKIKPKYICYLYPTTPLLKTKTLIKSFKVIKNKNNYQVFTISKIHSNIQNLKKIYKLKKNGELKIKILKKKMKVIKKYKSYYYDAGQLYWFNFSKQKIKKKSIGIIVSKNEAIDINTIKDFDLAKKVYSSIKNNK